MSVPKKSRHFSYAAATLASILFFSGSRVFGEVFSDECNVMPDQGGGWDVLQISCNPEQWVQGGWFHQHVELCDGYPPPGGQQGAYGRSLAQFVGVPTFFLEWRLQVDDAPRSEIPWGGGAAIALSNDIGVRYTFFIASDQVKLNRDNSLPIVFVDLESGIPHEFRLELFRADLYVWSIDGQVVDAGIPEGAYPSGTPELTWRAKAAWVSNTTRWDYIRYGTLPEGDAADTNCDGAIDFFDVDPFIIALFDADGYAQQHPACIRNTADVNTDGHIDFLDIDPFVECLFSACP